MILTCIVVISKLNITLSLKKKENGYSIVVVNVQERQHMLLWFLTLKEAWSSLEKLAASFQHHKIYSTVHQSLRVSEKERCGRAEHRKGHRTEVWEL